MPKWTTTPATFSFDRIDLSKGNYLYIIKVATITPELREYMDRVIGQLTYGNGGGDLDRVKRKIKKFLTPKKGTVQERGAIAEFFVHLFLNFRGYTPQFIASNLEEGSLKKGFDGLYTYKGAEWLCESKSGSLIYENVSHATKLTLAYRGLKKKLAGEDANNPWANALYHAKVVDAEETLVKKISELSDRFEDGSFCDITEYCIMPAATIYLDGEPDINRAIIEKEVTAAIKGFPCQQIRAVCITQNSVDAFWTYLNS